MQTLLVESIGKPREWWSLQVCYQTEKKNLKMKYLLRHL